MDVCLQRLELANDDETFMQKITTGDKSWIYKYDVETNVQSESENDLYTRKKHCCFD